MKTKWSFLVVLAIILTACGPVIPIEAPSTPVPVTSVPTVSAPVASTPVPSGPVASWPGMAQGWSTFWAPPYLYEPFYDPSGYIWVHNERGVYRWEIASGKMDFLTAADALPTGISSFAAFEGKVWAATQNGEVAVYDGKQWEAKKLTTLPLYNFSSAPGRLWVYGNNRAFFYEKGAWNEFQLTKKANYDGLAQLVQGKGNDIWCNFGGEIWRFDGKTWHHHENAGFPRKIFALPNGTIYFWTDSLLLKYGGKAYQPVMFPNNSYVYSVNQILQTDNGELWVILWLAGEEHSFIIHLDGTIEETPDISLPDSYNSDSSSFRTSAWTPDGLLASNQDEIILYKDGQTKSFKFKGNDFEELIRNYSIIGFAPDGALWLTGQSNYRDLARYDGQKLEKPFGELPEDLPFGITRINAQGELWSSTGYSGEFTKLKMGEKPVKYKIRITAIDFDFAPDGSLWLLSEDGYLAHIYRQEFEEGKVITPEYIRIGEGATEKTLSSRRMKVGPKGDVWVYAYEEGFYHYDGHSWEFDGGKVKLTNDSAFTIDKNGKLWAGVDYHLYKHDGKEWVDFPRNCIFPSGMTVAADGAIWFINGCNGVYRFDEQVWTHYTREKEMAGTVPDKIIPAPDGALWFISNEAWIRYQP